MEHQEITEVIIGSAFEVINTIGFGFLEKVYENSLRAELNLRGLHVEQQFPITVSYKESEVGFYIADLLVEDIVVVELKAVSALISVHSAQVINYLKATHCPTGLLINFGNPRLEIRRLYLDQYNTQS